VISVVDSWSTPFTDLRLEWGMSAIVGSSLGSSLPCLLFRRWNQPSIDLQRVLQRQRMRSDNQPRLMCLLGRRPSRSCSLAVVRQKTGIWSANHRLFPVVSVDSTHSVALNSSVVQVKARDDLVPSLVSPPSALRHQDGVLPSLHQSRLSSGFYTMVFDFFFLLLFWIWI
jgi:hypothetical protein